MSITIEPNKGLRLKLDRFTPIRTWHGGGNFWSHEFQLTVRQGALAAFLPRALEDDGSVLFEHRVGGVELASTSVSITSIDQVPARELQNLRDAVNELKSKAEDPRCDRTKRQMIESFRLPDPQTDRDLYRLTGKGSQQKLIVLWGVEREEGSALAPGAAVDLMHTPAAEESAPAARKKSKLVPILGCLAVLGAVAAGGYYQWQQEQKKQEAAAQAAAQAVQVARAAREAQAANQSRIAAFNARAAANARARLAGPVNDAGSPPSNAPGNLPSTSPSEPTSPLPATTAAGKSTGSATPAPTATNSSKSGVSADTKPNGTKSSQGGATPPGKSPAPKSFEPDKSRPIASGTPIGSVPIIAGPKLANALPTPVSIASRNSGTNGIVTGTPGAVVRDGRVVTGLPATVTRNGTNVVTGTPGAVVRDGKVVTGLPATVTRNGTNVVTGTPGAVIRDGRVVTGVPATVTGNGTNVVTGTPGAVIRDGKVVTGLPATVDRNGTNVVTGLPTTLAKNGTDIVPGAPGAVVGDGKGVTGVPGAVANGLPAASASIPMTTTGPPPVGISSLDVVSTSLSPLLNDGNVEVLLNVVARDDAGTVVNAPPISEWRVDGVVRKKADGTLADGPVLPLALPAGKHNITTLGRGADGNPFQTDADVIVSPKE